ncbi:Hypothetical protein SRAE_1000291700 [Strongyloides ratti]|uniref:Uncharacterized protein n=1 Tax=Strongyloides ratti TaxID=34506 RepID=A0A090MX19_STRRB|nr:Hypothetical protein SRAE_1000291700 [Strongyloides ratti]CEF64664.1 Hypothetical protein SRAE_1000291700 [Strongyloides ratti]
MKITLIVCRLFITIAIVFNGIFGGFMDEATNVCDFTSCVEKCSKELKKPGTSPLTQAYCVKIKKKSDTFFRNIFTAYNQRCVCTVHPPPEFVDE